MKEFVDVFDCATEICKALKKGALLTTSREGHVNTMTIGWGTLGIEWSRPVFMVYVRESRYTRELLDKTGEFTINIPNEATDKKILSLCGSKSGRDVDKVQTLGLTLEEPEVIHVPGIRELPLTLECRVLSQHIQDAQSLPQDIQEHFYPEINGRQDRHIAYYGEILSAYRIV